MTSAHDSFTILVIMSVFAKYKKSDREAWLKRSAAEECHDRNQVLTLLYGRLPSYAYFQSGKDLKDNWLKWWNECLEMYKENIEPTEEVDHDGTTEEKE